MIWFLTDLERNETFGSKWIKNFFIRLTVIQLTQHLKADRHEATLPLNYCMQPCYATYAMSNHDVQRLHGKRCTPRLRDKVAPCLSTLMDQTIHEYHHFHFKLFMNIIIMQDNFHTCFHVRYILWYL